MNLTPTLTIAGTWFPSANALAQTQQALIKLGTSGQYGLVVTGWSTSNQTSQVSIGLLDADGSGGMKLNTSSYIADPVTNMSNSIVVADFNADGKPDVFLPPYRENPFTPSFTTVYLSNKAGGFTKTSLTDSVVAHDAAIFNVNGTPTVFTATFTSASQSNPVYQFLNGNFVESQPTNIKNLTGMSTAIVNSGNSVGLELVRADGMNVRIYTYNGNDLVSQDPIQIIKPYLSTLPQYATSYPAGTYRVWVDDLNHDGKQDILAGESMFSSTGIYPSALQVLLNKGDGTFKDVTANLNPEMSINTSELDYSPSFVDLDHSGINSYLFAGSTSWSQPTREADYTNGYSDRPT